MITTARPITPTTAIGGGVPVLVIAPRSGHGQQAAQAIHRALLELGARADLQVDPDDAVMRTAPGPVILVGNLADSRSIRWLYYRSLCSTDLWYPGPSGHELRTLCNPFGSGHNLILVGYSDTDGARIAGEKLLTHLADPIPHLKDLHATRLPLSAIEANDSRT
ncbi:MAG: hypothetical protein K9M98_03705, partial [Cephaloticoccus sp.]|nr:hypothetical protein [Cephaloticoccus sp.]